MGFLRTALAQPVSHFVITSAIFLTFGLYENEQSADFKRLIVLATH